MIHAQTSLKKNRDFGYLFSFIAMLCSAYIYQKNASLFWVISILILGLGLLLTTLLQPHLLTPLAKAWYLLGDLLGKVISPIVLGVIFFLLITPIAIIGKLLGRDELALKKKSTNTYWINRPASSHIADSFKNQF